MKTRDFSKSNKEFIKNNKIILSVISAILVIGLLVAIIFGFNNSIDFTGYNKFEINLGSELSSGASKDISKVQEILVSNKFDVYTIQIEGEGDLAKLVVKYTNNVYADDYSSACQDLISEFSISSGDITEVQEVEGFVAKSDFIFAVSAILLITTVLTIYFAIRFNLACAIANLLTQFVSIWLLLSVSAILRFEVGMSFFFVVTFMSILLGYEMIILFENIEKEKAISKTADKAEILQNAEKVLKLRTQIMSVMIFVVGLVLIVFAPYHIKQVAITLLFADVIVLLATSFTIPFVWSMCITKIKERVRVKKSKDDSKKKTITDNSLAKEESVGEILAGEDHKEEKVIEVSENKTENSNN